MKQLLRSIHKRIGLRTRLRRFRLARSFIRRHRGELGVRRAYMYWRWDQGPKTRRLLKHDGRKLICRFGRGQTDRWIWTEVFHDRANDCVDLESASWIIDAGATVGYTAVWFAERYPKAKVIAIEPDTENFEILCANVAHEPRIIPMLAAVTPPGAPRQRVVFGSEQGHPAGLRTLDVEDSPEAGEDTHAVDAVDIASLMERFEIEHLDLLKMDIEGAERAVFDDCADWIDRVEAIIVEVHDRLMPGCSESFDRATTAFAIREVGPEGSYRVYVRRGTPVLSS